VTSVPRIGVALGGGSARGYAHIGALASLERHGFAPDTIVGTSFGAVVGALYAMARSPEALERQAAALRRRDVLPRVLDVGLHRGALFAGRRLEAYFDALVEGRAFEDLDRDLRVVTTDAATGERVVLTSGPLAPALRASASLPGLFAPVEIGGRRLLDGGVGSPTPLETLEAEAFDLRIAIGVGTDADASRTIRGVRWALTQPWGRRVHAAMGRAGPGHVGDLVRALAWTAEGYLRKVPEDALHVEARPPIHWLRFDRAGDAVVAGERALEAAVPRLMRARAAWVDGGAGG
jgi:NTE family protein